LSNLVLSKPISRIAKENNVSWGAIRKRCVLFGIEIPKRKMWDSSLQNLNYKRKKIHRYCQLCGCEIGHRTKFVCRNCYNKNRKGNKVILK
jgi:hypothetical protein